MYCTDYYRNYSKPCFLCDSPVLTEDEKKMITDNTEHILSNRCKVAHCPEVVAGLKAVKLRLRAVLPTSVLLSEISCDQYRAKWILNPCCVTLGADKVTPEQLQVSGLDAAIRLYAHKLIQSRYSLLKKAGFIMRTAGVRKHPQQQLGENVGA